MKYIVFALWFIIRIWNEIQEDSTAIRQLAIVPAAFPEPQKKSEPFPCACKPEFHVYWWLLQHLGFVNSLLKWLQHSNLPFTIVDTSLSQNDHLAQPNLDSCPGHTFSISTNLCQFALFFVIDCCINRLHFHHYFP